MVFGQWSWEPALGYHCTVCKRKIPAWCTCPLGTGNKLITISYPLCLCPAHFIHSTDVAIGFWMEVMLLSTFHPFRTSHSRINAAKTLLHYDLSVMFPLRYKKLLTTKLYSYTQRRLSLSSLLCQQHLDGPTVLNYDMKVLQISVAFSGQFLLVPITNHLSCRLFTTLHLGK